MSYPRYVTHGPLGYGTTAALPDSTPPDDQKEGDEERFRLYRLCPCGECSGTGKELNPYGPPNGNRCRSCRGEGRTLELVATCGNPEAVGVALVTLASEGEWDECPFGLMHRPKGETGRWLVKPWPASPRNVSDAGRLLRAQR